MLSKILVGFDGSDCSRRALELALQIAEKFSAAVTIINVAELSVYNNPQEPLAISPDAPAINNDLRRAHRESLTKAANASTRFHPGINVSIELREGNAPSQIVAFAKEGAFDLIVVGHGGASRLRELILGSTSERVAHLAKCPVLIVK